MITIHGIKACDTMKKAFTWLDGHGVAYDFHDFKKLGIDQASLEQWCDTCGWEKVINRAGTTFRKLPEEARLHLDRHKAIALMLAQPSMIKRPVVVHDGGVEIGFSADRYAQVFGV